MNPTLFDPPKRQGFSLRDYQAQDADEVCRLWADGIHRVLCVHATGLGKSLMAAELSSRKPIGSRALVIVDSTDLAADLFRTCQKHTGRKPGILTGDFKENHDADILIATKQCLCAGERYKQIDATQYDRVIVDECEAALANEYVALMVHLLEGNPALNVVGLTATPLPSGNRNIGDLFSHAANEPGPLYRDLQWAYLNGWLVKPMQGILRCSMDFSSLKVRKQESGERDYSDKDIAKLMLEQDEREWLELAGGIHQIAKGHTAIVVCPNSTEVADKLAGYVEGAARAEGKRGVAYSIHRKLGRRQSWDLMRRFKSGEFPIAVSVRMFEKGFDYDRVNMVIMVRRTKSLRLYCLDSETEVLTPNGWKRGLSLLEGDSVAGFNLETGSIQWEPVVSHISRPLLDGERMLAASGPSVDIRLTDSHRVVVSRRFGRSHKWKPWEIARAGDLLDMDQFSIPSSGIQQARGIPLSNAEIAFIGLVMTDGNFNPHNNQISLYQSEGSPVFDRFDETLGCCGFKFGKVVTTKPSNLSDRGTPFVRWTVSKGRPRGRDSHLRGWGELENYIPKVTKNWTPWENATEGQWAVLLEAMHWGDGTKAENQGYRRQSYHIAICNLENAEAIQSLSVRRGWKCSMSRYESGRERPIYYLHLKKTPRITLTGTRGDRSSRLKVVEHDPDELVWCISVPSGAFISRRNGKVCVMGNTQIAGRGTRPLTAIRPALGAESDPKARMRIIAESAKPSCVIVDCVGINDEAKNILGVIDILGRGVSQDIKERVREMMIARAKREPAPGGRPEEETGIDVGDEARQAVKDLRQEREDRERERRARLSAKVDTHFELDDARRTQPKKTKLAKALERGARMPFGKHKGELVKNLSTGYLSTFRAKVEIKATWLRKAIDAELERRGVN